MSLEKTNQEAYLRNFLLNLITLTENTTENNLNTKILKCGVQAEPQVQYGMKLGYINNKTIRFEPKSLDNTSRIIVKKMNASDDISKQEIATSDIASALDGSLDTFSEGTSGGLDPSVSVPLPAKIGFDIYIISKKDGLNPKLYFAETGRAPQTQGEYEFISGILGFVAYNIPDHGGIIPFSDTGKGEFLFERSVTLFSGDLDDYGASNAIVATNLTKLVPHLSSALYIYYEKPDIMTLTGATQQVDLDKVFCISFQYANNSATTPKECVASSGGFTIPVTSDGSDRIINALKIRGESKVGTKNAKLYVRGFKLLSRIGQ
ncbi:MAG: hypothetical protein HY072_08950 [Deltaproteobacteria bacterium]|nr:hypothetical protein [Deltaproteobacteria bacterium]